MPTCRVAGHSGSVAGPVVLPVKDRPHAPGPWCCRRAALPAGCRRAARGAAGRSLGKRCRPVVLPGQDRPHAPGPWCCQRAALPVNSSMCCASGAFPARFRRYRFTFSILSFWILRCAAASTVTIPLTFTTSMVFSAVFGLGKQHSALKECNV